VTGAEGLVRCVRVFCVMDRNRMARDRPGGAGGLENGAAGVWIYFL